MAIEELEPLQEQTTLEEPQSELAEAVDAYGQISEELTLLKAKVKTLEAKLKETRKPLDEWAVENLQADQPGTLSGNQYELAVSANRKKVENIHKQRLIKIIGEKRFMEVAEVGITKIRAMLSESETAQVLDEFFTGGRALKAIRKE